MRYWWVNQNQTHRQELEGGYLWSPKRNANDARNPFYEFMREVAPGDVVFSFVDTKIIALGIVTSYCYGNPKPAEFGGAGTYWNTIGWRVRVTFSRLNRQIRPKDHMGVLQKVFAAATFGKRQSRCVSDDDFGSLGSDPDWANRHRSH